MQQHPLPIGGKRRRFQEALDLTEPQPWEPHLALALPGLRALAGEEAGPVWRAEDRVQWFRVQAMQRGEHLAGFAGNPVLVWNFPRFGHTRAERVRWS